MIEDGQPIGYQRPRPCWNILSALTPFLGLGGAILSAYFQEGEHFVHVAKVAEMTLGVFLAFGFVFGCIALVRFERIWGITALGIVLNAPFILVLVHRPWDMPF